MTDATPITSSGDLRAMHAVVIAGGRSAEHDVSLASARGILGLLAAAGVSAELLTIGRDGRWSAGGTPVDTASAVRILQGADVALPVLHGEHGEDGAIAGFLSILEVPFSGSPVRAGAISMHKHLTKLVAADLGIPVARGITLRRGEVLPDLTTLGLPLVVKPDAAGSSLGVEVVHDNGDLDAAVERTFAYGDTALVEEYVDGDEVDIAILEVGGGDLFTGPTLGVPRPRGSHFSTGAKYGDRPAFEIPARVGVDATAAIEDAARRLYRALGCAGIARFDFFVRGDDVVLNEVNTAPGMSAGSQVPQMFRAAGMTDAALAVELLRTARIRSTP